MDEFRRAWRVTTFEQYVEALIQLFDSFPGRDVSELFLNLHHVYITRADHVRQAVSFARATQTERWSSLQEATATRAVYSAAEIASLIEWIEREEVAWERYLAESRAPVLRVVYENLVADIEGTVVEVMRFLEIDLPPGFTVPAPTLDRQADHLTEDWVARYRAEEQRV